MALSTYDLTKGIDFTALANAAAADHNTLVDSAAPYSDSATEGKGLVLWTVDTALNTPNAPEADVTTKWKRYLWIRIPHATAASQVPLLYVWQPSTGAWREQASEIANVLAVANVAQADATTAIGDAAAALTIANAANSTAATASSAAATAAGDATTALAAVTQAATDATQALADAAAAQSTADTAKTASDTATTNVNTLTGTVTAFSTAYGVITSAFSAFSAGTTVTIAHALAAIPKSVRWVAYCVSPELGFTAGQEVPISHFIVRSGGYAFNAFVEAADNANLKLYQLAGAVEITPVTGAAVTTITPANWSLRCHYAKQS